MGWRRFLLLLSGVALAGLFAYYLSFPVSAPAGQLPVVSVREQAKVIEDLKPVRGRRPLVAILGANEGSETTDYVIPYSVLKRSGLLDVVALGVEPGPVSLVPSLAILPDRSLQEFDADHPEGADYVIVPAFHDRRNTHALAWLKAQASKGAMVVGICEGALVLAEAGLLKGKRATTHWHAISDMKVIEPTVTYVPDRRYVVDGRVATTTGVSASLPVSLAIVEAVGGPEVARHVADGLGVTDWGVAHSSAPFMLTRRDVRTVVLNVSTFWRHNEIGIDISGETDEVALALVADAYSRTFAAQVFAVGRSPVRTQGGLRFETLPSSRSRLLIGLQPGPSVQAFRQALDDIAVRYGKNSAALVRLTMEYPGAP